MLIYINSKNVIHIFIKYKNVMNIYINSKKFIYTFYKFIFLWYILILIK